MLQRLRHVFSERLNVAKTKACVLREAKCCTALDQTSEHTSAQPNNIALPPLGRWVILTETSPRLQAYTSHHSGSHRNLISCTSGGVYVPRIHSHVR